jgi:hypothetical protein
VKGVVPLAAKSTYDNERRSLMKPRNFLEVNGKLTLSALALALATVPAVAAEPATAQDGHAFVRTSILNTWTPSAVASPTEGKMDAHQRARLTIVGTAKSPSAAGATSAASGIDAQEQARRLLLAQPVVGQQPLVAADRTDKGS